ncbi:MAG: citrate/2-methylcitrate synthase [Nanoarchaeota archaeon]|nr:citrate/2-methylcitrate synthase [Nanoarchaeota archaeon]MBU1704558.1 citrate/2-methylcitrate synthase [Nanoarchaeota archaeon]
MDEPFLRQLAKTAEQSGMIDQVLYDEYNVKRGLRNQDGTGVLVGLTHIGDVIGYKFVDGKKIPTEGDLLYRGISVRKLVQGFQKDNRQGFDETTFLLLFGKLPTKELLTKFSSSISELRDLPENFTEDMILKLKGKDIMNMLARCVLALYTLDENADDITTLNIIKQSINLIAKFPTIIAYSYQSMRYNFQGMNLSIRHPEKSLSTAENFLYMIKGDKRYTQLEAEVLDLCLVLHAEHGGGNNSSFTMHVVSSSHTDTYSAVAAAIGSLKGPLHGGANSQVVGMMDDLKNNITDYSDPAIEAYLTKVINKEAHDRSGKIYGFGHAVYTISDIRAILLKERVRELAIEHGAIEEFNLYEKVERLVPEVFSKVKGTAKRLFPNVDFYSGFVYRLLGIPDEIFTPLFAMARITGWSAHRIEEIVSAKRIIRPAYKNVAPLNGYKLMSER